MSFKLVPILSSRTVLILEIKVAQENQTISKFQLFLEGKSIHGKFICFKDKLIYENINLIFEGASLEFNNSYFISLLFDKEMCYN